MVAGVSWVGVGVALMLFVSGVRLSKAMTARRRTLQQSIEDYLAGQVNQALVQMQFQDRLSQIMTQVQKSMDRLPELLQEQEQRHAQGWPLQAVDAQCMLDEMKNSYVMADQHVIHEGGKVSQKNTTGIRYF